MHSWTGALRREYLKPVGVSKLHLGKRHVWLLAGLLFAIYILFTGQVYFKYRGDPNYVMVRSSLFNALQVLGIAAIIPLFLFLRKKLVTHMSYSPLMVFPLAAISIVVCYGFAISIATYGFGFNATPFSTPFLGKYFTSLALVHLIFLGVVWVLTPKPQQSLPGIWLDDRGHQILKSIGDILWIEALDHYVKVQTTDRSYLKKSSMKSLAPVLSDHGFHRIHRSYWINEIAIDGYIKDKGKLSVRMNDGRRLPVGKTYRRYAQQLMDAFANGSPPMANSDMK